MRQGDFPYFFLTKNRRSLSSRQFSDDEYENLAGVSAPRLKVVGRIIRFPVKIHKHRYVKKGCNMGRIRICKKQNRSNSHEGPFLIFILHPLCRGR